MLVCSCQTSLSSATNDEVWGIYLTRLQFSFWKGRLGLNCLCFPDSSVMFQCLTKDRSLWQGSRNTTSVWQARPVVKYLYMFGISLCIQIVRGKKTSAVFQKMCSNILIASIWTALIGQRLGEYPHCFQYVWGLPPIRRWAIQWCQFCSFFFNQCKKGFCFVLVCCFFFA